MDKNLTARIFKIERLNTHNGPGFRTVIFIKGCPLYCTWCHNPEGIDPQKQVWITLKKCIGCGLCVETCSLNALALKDTGIAINRELCNGCQDCANVCPSKAIEKLGEDVTTDHLMKIILKDQLFFENSGGGVTVTGGDPAIKPEFISELFQKCNQCGISTCLDTSGAISFKNLEEVLDYTDILSLDIKIIDPNKSLQHTGLNIENFRQSIEWLKHYLVVNPKSLGLIIRTPLIPGITDSEKNLKGIANLIEHVGVSDVKMWELCSFNTLCAEKYQKLNLKWGFQEIKRNSLPDLSTLEQLLPNTKIVISGFDMKV